MKVIPLNLIDKYGNDTNDWAFIYLDKPKNERFDKAIIYISCLDKLMIRSYLDKAETTDDEKMCFLILWSELEKLYPKYFEPDKCSSWLDMGCKENTSMYSNNNDNKNVAKILFK